MLPICATGITWKLTTGLVRHSMKMSNETTLQINKLPLFDRLAFYGRGIIWLDAGGKVRIRRRMMKLSRINYFSIFGNSVRTPMIDCWISGIVVAQWGVKMRLSEICNCFPVYLLIKWKIFKQILFLKNDRSTISLINSFNAAVLLYAITLIF